MEREPRRRDTAVCSRRAALSLLAAAGGALARVARGQVPRRIGGGDAAHRITVDVPIVADDPVAVPVTLSVDHPMEPEHYIKSLELALATDPVPKKGLFRFTPQSGRPSVAYQFRSGQVGELVATGECSRHGRFEARQALKVAPGGCAVPPSAILQEKGGSPVLRVDARVRAGEAATVWASLRHSSHTGLVERKGQFVPERPPYFVERVTVILGETMVSEFQLTAAVSADPRIRFFVRADPGKLLRVVFANSRGETWEATQRLS